MAVWATKKFCKEKITSKISVMLALYGADLSSVASMFGLKPNLPDINGWFLKALALISPKKTQGRFRTVIHRKNRESTEICPFAKR